MAEPITDDAADRVNYRIRREALRRASEWDGSAESIVAIAATFESYLRVGKPETEEAAPVADEEPTVIANNSVRESPLTQAKLEGPKRADVVYRWAGVACALILSVYSLSMHGAQRRAEARLDELQSDLSEAAHELREIKSGKQYVVMSNGSNSYLSLDDVLNLALSGRDKCKPQYTIAMSNWPSIYDLHMYTMDISGEWKERERLKAAGC